MLSIFEMIGGVTWLILAPFGGALVDRMSRVKIIYMTDFIRGANMLCCAVMTCLTKDPTVTMWGLCLASIICAINGALFGPASQTIIPLVVEEDSLVQANSLMSLMYVIKDVFGMFYASLGAFSIVLMNGISFLLSGIIETFIDGKEKITASLNNRSKLLVEIKQGFNYILTKNKALIMLFIVVNFKNLALGPIQLILVPYQA